MKTLVRAGLALVILLTLAVTPVLAGGPVVVGDKINMWTDIEDTVWMDCINGGDGEWVHATVRMHYVLYVRRDAQGKLHKTIQHTIHGFAEGLTSGDTYVGHDTHSETLRGEVYEEEYTVSGRTNLIGRGKQTDVKLKLLWHVTINANGEVTAEFDKERVTCK